MPVQKQSKVAIVGAGSVGTSLAYACLIRGVAREITLYDIDTKKVEAEVLDLAHGTQFTGSSVMTGSSDITTVAGADVVIITAGAKQKPGQTRLDLVGVNVGILESLMPQLVELAPNAVFVLVTNPCDVLTVVAQRISGLPPGRVISSGTVLDTSRLRWIIAKLAGGLAPTSVHATIVGEHGDSEFALWSQATIGPIPILDWERDGERPFTEDTLESITHDVRTAAYKVIEGKGATNYAIGLSGARIAEAIVNDEHAIMPVSTLLQGQWGIDDVAISTPVIVGANGVERILDTPMSPSELEKFLASAEEIRSTVRSVS
ncbi:MULTISPECIES: L-lactate dehydrogenase [unclassified Pseudoclavibacter]|uniref:L-lactate dehydrogenase n=1 Tax=unclassified Pseudoclavibacter TaxID=2615177 RepID=UPI000CE841F0|nr:MULTISPECIES: L-lactate dehydrogenase [unclassified Pseudoclavibacter]MBS3178934.1 L-lactate dehydrogenase [Pseudoclavibacter sp. Marseille-Q4354]NYF11745.1 L-lactate dehydrogenase [Pseudoclavibacter sp. JAI123]PPG32293.1 L-lactate dehydrogenase [Pseudoclavibacter sp. RFBB5]